MPLQNSLFEVRSKRKQGWFWLDNDYLNGYAKHFGTTGTAIYISLCRHADIEDQKCYPSQITIAEENGISSQIVSEYINLFKICGLISYERRKNSKTKRWEKTIYYLLDKKCWLSKVEVGETMRKYRFNKVKKNHPNNVGMDTHPNNVGKATPTMLKSHPNNVGKKVDPVKETHIKEDAFKNLIPITNSNWKGIGEVVKEGAKI